MYPQPVRAPKLAFGPFEFDPAPGELQKHGHKIRLASQPCQILGALLERPGDLVTRDDLRSRLWPGATAGDFEHGLNAAVNKLRQALGDSADQPLYVETLPTRGYRFVAPIRPLGRAVLELVPATTSAAETQEPPRRVKQWTAAVAGLMLALVAGASWMAFHRSPVPPLKATQLLITPPKGYYFEGGGVRQSFALSPDGGQIAFTAKDASGAFRLFLRDLSELESRPVADGEGAYSVVWTPDGRMLLFTAKGKLRRIAVNAGASQILSDAVPYFSSAIPFGPDLLLVSSHRNSGVMPSSGGTPQPIARLYSWAQPLPGGRDFLYTFDDPQLGSLRARIATTGGNEPGIEVVQADSRVQYTGSLRRDSGYLVYLRGGTLLAQPFDLAVRRVIGDPRAIARHVPSYGFTGAADFSVSRRGTLAYQTYVNRSQFIWVDRTGKRLSTASPGEISANYVRLSPDGRWLATVPFDIERGVPEIWLYDAVSGPGRKVVFGPDIRHVPVWSPDSRRLVYNFGHSWPRLGLSSLDGTPEKEPLPDTGFMVPTDWSPDGRFILYNNSALPAITHDFPSDVFAIDMARNRKVIQLLNTPFYEYNAVFSPDGNWLAFLSNESGQAEVYMQKLDRSNDSLRVIGERFLISRQGAQCLRWRRNGKELFYLGADGRVYAVPLVSGADSVRAGQPEPLFTIDAEARAAIHSVVSFDVSADGSRFVIPSMTPGESSALVVLQDWESLVAK
jgi:Tol biopolymer transport system component/DNA-binding winged helix-turn-helix (wHTH) protein